MSRKKKSTPKDPWVFALVVVRESERSGFEARAAAAGMEFQDWCLAKLRSP